MCCLCRPNGWTDWAQILCGHSWVAVRCFRLKKILHFSLIFFSRATPALQLVFYIELKKNTIDILKKALLQKFKIFMQPILEIFR